MAFNANVNWGAKPLLKKWRGLGKGEYYQIFKILMEKDNNDQTLLEERDHSSQGVINEGLGRL